MDMMRVVLLGIGIVVVLANILVSYRVARSNSFEPHQKYIQCALIWLLPVVGAAVAYVFKREPKMSIRGNPAETPSYGLGELSFGDGAGDYFSGGDH